MTSRSTALRVVPDESHPAGRAGTGRKLEVEPRGLHRDAAEAYIGVSCTKFDQLVRDGRMPPPKCIDRRRLWDRHALDIAFEELPHENDNEWDAILE